MTKHCFPIDVQVHGQCALLSINQSINQSKQGGLSAYQRSISRNLGNRLGMLANVLRCCIISGSTYMANVSVRACVRAALDSSALGY